MMPHPNKMKSEMTHKRRKKLQNLMLKSEETHKRRKTLCHLSQSLIPKSEEKEERSCLHCLFSLLSTSDPETTKAKSDRRKCEISREESLS